MRFIKPLIETGETDVTFLKSSRLKS
jgi:hypothetical protein